MEEQHNITSNVSASYMYSAAAIRTTIEDHLLPTICIIGLLSNTLAMITFLQKTLRNKSCSLYLAVRSLSDIGFLGTLFTIWISAKMTFGFGSVMGLCQVILFLTYVCGCLSVWLVVFVTAENYIRICHPFIVRRYCTTKCAKILITILTLVILMVYNFPLWISHSDCSPNVAHIGVTQVFIYADTLLTLIIPVLLMAGLLISILYTLVGSSNRRAKYSAPVTQRRSNPMARVTKMLLAVSIIFLLMNLPSHVIRIQILINSFLAGYADATYFEGLLQTITYQIYYSSLGINLFVYLAFGKQFRQIFKQTFFFRKASQRNPIVATAVNERFTELKICTTPTTIKRDSARALLQEGTTQGQPDCNG